jgi:hypothetical protein
MGRTLRSKGNGGSHEHGSGILADCNGGRSCSVGCGASLRSNFYPYTAEAPRQKSLVVAKERPRHAERETGLVIDCDFLPSKAGLIYEAIGLVGDQHLCVSSTWPIGDRLARARRPNRAPRPSAGAELTLGGVMAPPRALIDATSARRVRCQALDTRKHSTHHGNERR